MTTFIHFFKIASKATQLVQLIDFFIYSLNW